MILPPWATDARDFIRKHRAALESEYVSSNLHHWIDLIFGYKQQGPAAVEAVNVFMFTSYEGKVDLDKIEDPRERAAIEGMVRELGQTPAQLLTTPHPARLPIGAKGVALEDPGSAFATSDHCWDLKKAFFVEMDTDDPVAVVVVQPPEETLLAEWMRSGLAQRMLTVSVKGFVGAHDWLPTTASKSRPFTLDVDPAVISKSKGRECIASGALDAAYALSPKRVVLTPDNAHLIVAGCWDNTIKICETSSTLPARSKVVFISHPLNGTTSCLCLDNGGEMLAVGCSDGTCSIYKLVASTAEGLEGVGPAAGVGTGKYKLYGPVAMMYGLGGEISAVAISTALDLGVTASENGDLVFHTLTPSGGSTRDGCTRLRCIRPVPPPTDKAPPYDANNADPSTPTIEESAPAPVSHLEARTPSFEMISMTSEGSVVAYCQWLSGRGSGRKPVGHSLYSFSINGSLIAADHSCGTLSALAVSPAARYAFHGACIVASSPPGVGTALFFVMSYPNPLVGCLIVSCSCRYAIACRRRGVVTIRDVQSLVVRRTMSTNKVPIRTVAVTSNESHMFLGLADGKLVIVPLK